LQHNCLMIA